MPSGEVLGTDYSEESEKEFNRSDRAWGNVPGYQGDFPEIENDDICKRDGIPPLVVKHLLPYKFTFVSYII